MRKAGFGVVLLLVLGSLVSAQDAPLDGAGWFRLAGERLQQGRHAEALAAYEKAWQLGASPFVAAYNAACLHARAGRADAAFDWLGRVATQGVRPDQLRADTDLVSLHADPRWARLLETAEEAAHPCRKSPYRQLDFWIGAWEVSNPAGQVVGTSRIEPILDGCVVLETWTGRLGETGQSFNLYDAAKGRWQQTWVSDKGVLTEYHGELRDGALVYRSSSPGRDGKPRHRRLTFTPLPDGRVRQLSEVTVDGGTSWSVEYDFSYRKRGAPEAAPGAQ